MSNGSGVLRLNRFSYQDARMGFDPASLGDARLDAAQSSLLRDGSVPVREQALATRLQTRIQDEAAAAMRNAQSLYNRANMEQYMGRANARAQKTAAAGTLLSGFAQGGNALLKW